MMQSLASYFSVILSVWKNTQSGSTKTTMTIGERNYWKKLMRKHCDLDEHTKMNYYKVQFKQTETFIVDVEAESEEQARVIAEEKCSNGDYEENGDCEMEIDMVFDVTNTDDEPQEECCVCKEYKFMYDLEKADNDKFICQKCKYLTP